ncbi:unnamed protein product [Caenorhabditis sp. 36 PRJEB53466]|nr:unnamed protein product [Caenorhabditis sp. 36 PRJEB53466]
MAGRKSPRSENQENAHKPPARKSAILSPHEELRERLLETAIDTKENIPEEEMRKARGSATSDSGSVESRKRRSTKEGPAAKRHSGEKARDGHGSSNEESSISEDHSFGSSSTESLVSSRQRGRPLPVMMEEDEVFEDGDGEMARLEHEEPQDDDDDGHAWRSRTPAEELEAILDEDETFEDEEFDDDDDVLFEDGDVHVQNELFAFEKKHMNDGRLMEAPSLLSTAKCEGIGSPRKVWSLMVKRDELPRATHCLLNSHPEMSVGMRKLLLDWMMEVSDSENLHRETFHLAVDYVDRYLEATGDRCSQDTFQLVGTAALFIAAKYEEIYPPKCTDFAALTDGAFSADNIREMEILVSKDIGWSFGPITSIHWLSTYLQLLGTGKPTQPSEHYEEKNMYVPELLRTEFIEMCKILDYLLFDLESFHFSYRTLAAAVLFVVYEPKAAVEHATGFSREQLHQVIRYVKPICHVFNRLRQVGDVIPKRSHVKDDDLHNIQVHFKFDEIEPLVKKERERLSRLRQRLV